MDDKDFKPFMTNKNVNGFSTMMDNSKSYWLHKPKEERKKNVKPLQNVGRKGCLVFTKQEFQAISVIIRCF